MRSTCPAHRIFLILSRCVITCHFLCTEPLIFIPYPMIYKYIYIFFCGSATQRGSWPPHSWGFSITHNDAPQSVGLLWTSDQLVAETSTWTTLNIHNRQTSMTAAGFEPIISAGERPQIYALDHAATGTGPMIYTGCWNCCDSTS